MVAATGATRVNAAHPTMTRLRPRRSPFARALVPVLGALALTWGAATTARAVEPPTGANFDIWYYATDANGERSRLFSDTDLAGFVNRARCECGQDISTKVLLKRAMTSYDNNVRVQTFIGSRCDVAVGSPQVQAKPCVRVISTSPNAYTKALNFSFDPVWLAGGVELSGSVDIADAVPSGSCAAGQGDAGIWVCIENGMQPECQADEFEVQGTQNKNASATSMAQGIHYDFEPPQTLPQSFSISAGDGAIEITWEQLATGDVSGFRVLCADENGDPLPGKGIKTPSLTGINRGTIYFTKENLCPGGVFAEPGSEDTTTGGSDGGSDGGSTTTAGELWEGMELVVDPDPFAATGSSSGSSGSSGTSTTGTGTGTGTGTDTGTTLPSSGIESLDWAYVCTGHISGTSREARISGLENEKPFQFLVVAYDLAGNPIAASDVLVGTPRETLDLWEECEAAGDICGNGGFCKCTTDGDGDDGRAAWSLGLLALGAWVRRRRRA